MRSSSAPARTRAASAQTVDTFTLGAQRRGREDSTAGLSALEIEANRVKEFGFGAAELERARKWMLASYDRAYSERDKTESGSYAQEYVNHFLEDEPSPGIDYEYQLAKQLDSGDHRRGSRRRGAAALCDDEPRDPRGVAQKAGRHDADRRAAARRRSRRGRDGGDRLDRDGGHGVLMEHVPDQPAAIDAAQIPELGVTVVRFAERRRGVAEADRLQERPGPLLADRVGWRSLAPPADYLEAQLAHRPGRAVRHRRLTARSTCRNCSPARSPSASPVHRRSRRTGSPARARPANLETALQLLHLTVHCAGRRSRGFALIKKQLEAPSPIATAIRGCSSARSWPQVNTVGSLHLASR